MLAMYTNNQNSSLSLPRFCFVLVGSILGASLLPANCLAQTIASTASGSATDTGLSEITITAQRYEATIQDTPISISALSGDELISSGITSVEDITRTIPGLSMRSAGPGQSEYDARGIASNGGASATVGFYLDEVPLSAPTLDQVGKVMIEPDLYDVSRVEVLRGPQGTLYGSGSMGGAIKIVTNQPKLGTYEASVEGTVSGTEGGGLNGGGNAMINLPIGDMLAVRIVGTETWRSGWIDRVVLNPFPGDSTYNPGGGTTAPYVRGNVAAAPVQYVDKDANTEFLDSGRVSVLFQPTSALSIVASAMAQHMAMGAYDEFDSPPGVQYLSRYEPFNVPEPIEDDIHIESLTITAHLGFADLTSATAYYDRQETQTQDGSESISVDNNLLPNGTENTAPTYSTYMNSPYSEDDFTRQLSQEVRLSSSGSEQLHWTVGAFWSELNSIWLEDGFSTQNINQPQGVFYYSDNPYRMEQAAVFFDGSYKFANNWTFSTGARWYDYKSRQLEFEYGSDAPNLLPPATSLSNHVSNSGFNPRFNLSYEPNEDLNTYISASRGFRPGGVNQIFPPPDDPPFCSVAPLTFSSDSVWDYELGEKAKMFNNWLTVNGDIFYIVWDGVQQTPLINCGYEYITNAGNGRSFGPELEIDAKLSTEWTLELNGAYTDATITNVDAGYKTFLQAVDPGGAPTCRDNSTTCYAPILNVPKETANLTLLYSTVLPSGYKFSARATSGFVGTTVDEAFYFGIRLPSYNIVNARAALSGDRWSAALFITNVTDKVAEISSNNTSFQFNIPQVIRYSTNQPRTFGTQFDYRF
jgi:outer membrane receptor protein involved in Fe transport